MVGDHVWWCAGDIDDYTIDLKALNDKVHRLGLPLVLCRTKSGGAHLYCFFTEPVAAGAARSRMVEWVALLGHAGVEVFPKQTALVIDSDADYGSWLNMPYQGGAKTVRYALGPTGGALSPTQFLAYAESKKITPTEFAEHVTLAPNEDDRLPGGPPCLAKLAHTGVPPGGRNNALFNYGVYCKKANPDHWKEMLAEINKVLLEPPLPPAEVAVIVKSLGKKNYNYRCKDQPIVSLCDRDRCLTCVHGVGGDRSMVGAELEFGKLTKIETVPPLWVWDINGVAVELTTEELTGQRGFALRVVEELTTIMKPMAPHQWQKHLVEHLAGVQVVIPPPDALPVGQMLFHLQRFCNGRAQARSLDELLLGKPFSEKGRSYFVAADFLGYLQQQRVTGMTERKLYGWLREHDVQHHSSIIKGRSSDYWSIPEFSKQTEAFTVPRDEETGEPF